MDTVPTNPDGSPTAVPVLMNGLDAIPDPDGSGYLGVYYSNRCAVTPAPGTECAARDQDNRVYLGESNDLLNWTRVAELDARGANMPVIRSVGGEKVLLAYEDYGRPGDTDNRGRPNGRSRLVVRYYTTRARLRSNTYSREVVLPRSSGNDNEGTPNFESVTWTTSTFTSTNSTIRINYHFNPRDTSTAVLPDREGSGTLKNFRTASANGTWTTTYPQRIDNLLRSEGFPGKHGKRTRFTYDGETWRVYEAQRDTNYSMFNNWGLVLLRTATAGMQNLNVSNSAGLVPSIGVPNVKVLPAPDGDGDVLFTTAYVFEGGNGVSYGPTLYFHKLDPDVATRSRVQVPTGEPEEDVDPAPTTPEPEYPEIEDPVQTEAPLG